MNKQGKNDQEPLSSQLDQEAQSGDDFFPLDDDYLDYQLITDSDSESEQGQGKIDTKLKELFEKGM